MRTVTAKQVSQMGQYEPHPYALLMPPLSDEEYRGLKASIATMGIKTPVELDEDSKILDGVHRCKIAGELGIDIPVNVNTGLDDDSKLKLAIGLNLYRRHMDSGRRYELVSRLFQDGLSVRRIADATGWSKSTIGRDVQEVKTDLLHQHAVWFWCESFRGEKEPTSLSRWVGPLLRQLGFKTPEDAVAEALRQAWTGDTGLVAAVRSASIGREYLPGQLTMTAALDDIRHTLDHECGWTDGDGCGLCEAVTHYLVNLNHLTKGGRASSLVAKFTAHPPQCLDDVAELAFSRELFTSHEEWRAWIVSSGIADALGEKVMAEFDAFNTEHPYRDQP